MTNVERWPAARNDIEVVAASDYDALRAELAVIDAQNNKGTGIIIELTCELDEVRAEAKEVSP